MKKFLNIVELIVMALVLWTIVECYDTSSSMDRYADDIFLARLSLDIGIALVLITRGTLVICSFRIGWNDLKRSRVIDYLLFTLYLLLTFMDLRGWIMFEYFAALYGICIFFYLLPALFWSIEIVERRANENRREKIRSYIIAGLIALSIYLIILNYLHQLYIGFREEEIDNLKEGLKLL